MKGKKETKKSVSYKPATPLKDIIPPAVKEPPRQARPLKALDAFAEIDKKNSLIPYDVPQAWPGNEAARAFDFAVESEVAFKDPLAKQVENAFQSKRTVCAWMRLNHGYRLADHDRKYQFKGKVKQVKSQNKSCAGDISYNLDDFEYQKQQLSVCAFTVRQETPLEYERRKKEEAERLQKLAKDKKKAVKKEEVKDEGPGKVREAALTNVQVNEKMWAEGRWIGSQLQYIKDRDIVDIYSGEQVWKKIYPQHEGIPVLNKSGRYWVKLYYMGKEVKVEIDDRFPFSYRHFLLPVSQSGLEVWPTILSKAVLKLLMFNKQPVEIVGNPLVLYSLTGLVAEKIPFNKFTQWEYLNECLSDQKYASKDTHLLLYCNKVAGKLAPSNLIEKMADLAKLFDSSNKDREQKQVHKEAHKRRSASAGQRTEEVDKRGLRPGVLKGYCYPVIEGFVNNGFNMVYVQKKSARESKLRSQYNEVTKYSLTNKSIEEKKEHRRRKKELKEKLVIEEQKRMELIMKPAKPYRIFRLLNTRLSINCEFSCEEISIAKRCIVNDLAKPPNYDSLDTNQRSVNSYSVTGSKKERLEADESPKQLDDFSSVLNYKEPLARTGPGIWVFEKDLASLFDELLVFYNPNNFEHKIVTSVESNGESELTYDPSKELLLIQKSEEEHTRLLVSFAPKYAKNEKLVPEPFCILQRYDFYNFESVENYKTLKGNLNATVIRLSNNNQVLRLLSMTPLPYNLWVSCSSAVRLCSISAYLTEFEKYSSKNIPFEYPDLEADKFAVLARFKFSNRDTDTRSVVRLKLADPHLVRFMRYRVIENTGLPPAEEHEGVVDNKSERTFVVLPYFNLSIAKGTSYYLLVECCIPSNTPTGQAELQILSRHESTSFELDQQVEPVRFIQKVIPNKYAFIFSERLFVAKESAASFFVEIFNSETVQPPSGGDNKKGGKGPAPVVDITQSALGKAYQIRLTLKEEKNTTVVEQGFNRCLLNYVGFKPGRSYILSCKFVSEQPEFGKLYFSIKVYASETIALVRDTVKEDAEKAVRLSWEEKQPGRAANAKQARKRYFLYERQLKGETLTPEELQLLEAKKKKPEEADDKKKGKDAKKGKPGKKEEQVQAPKKVEQKRPPPKSSENYAAQLHQFLQHMQCSRLIQQTLAQGEKPIVRSAENLREIREGALMGEEEYPAMVYRNMRISESLKLLQKEQKTLLLDFIAKSRESYKSLMNSYITNRTSVFEALKSQNQRFRAIVDLLKADKPNEEELNKQIGAYSAAYGKNGFGVIAKRVVDNLKIQALNDRITAALGSYDIDELTKCVNEVKSSHAELEEELLTRATELLEEVEANPGLLAEKQAELKKAGKKGKK